MKTPRTQAILIAIEDPALHPEAMHVAAATGRPIIESTNPSDISRHFHRASAVLIDAATAVRISNEQHRDRIFLLDLDPGPSNWKAAVQIHAQEVFILPAQTAELLAVLGREDSRTPAGAGQVIGVMGAVGGVGASTLAAALARKRSGLTSTVLIDGVPASGGIDLLMGVEEVLGARWPDVGFNRGTVQAKDVLQALPQSKDTVAVLSTARSKIIDPFQLTPAEISAAINCFMAADTTIDVIVDLPNTWASSEIMEHLSYVVLVVPAEVRGVAAAGALKLEIAAFQTPLVVVLRHRGWSGLNVGDVEEILGTDVLAELGTIAKLPKTLEMQGLTGLMPRALSATADAIWAEIDHG
ncbi:septum site determining protein [Corynebacterium callunae]|uniref:septum site-determining protein Ssd n=1 Tax=Corynebacterium callunae TaxID=1721 RepID=UPI0039826ABB